MENRQQLAPVREQILVEKRSLALIFVRIGTRYAYFVLNGIINRWETDFSTNILCLTAQNLDGKCLYILLI